MIKVIVLGTAQDGGVPHLGCRQSVCERARRDPAQTRWVTSLAVVDTEAKQVFLIDATPDVRPQLDYLARHPDAPPPVGRNPVSGLILTHAHIGHYTGLIQFGKEVMATRSLPAWCTPRMAAFLRANGPWSGLIKDDHISLLEVAPVQPEDEPLGLTAGFSVRMFPVPHRQEWSDTVGLELIGPSRRLLYITDIDRWSDWYWDIRDVVAPCAYALLDGCFYSGGELGGRDMSQVPHPLITETMDRLAGSAAAVYFTHLNHTNPAIEPDSPERRVIEERGFQVAEDRMEFEL
jgi:pyrroloquinoline quinone biosynthesis protein B